MYFVNVAVIAITFILPAVFFTELFRAKFKSKLEWLIVLVMVTMMTGSLFLSSQWSIPGYYFRILLIVLFIIVALVSFKKMRYADWKGPKKWGYRISIGFYAALSVVFGIQVIGEISGYFYHDKAVELDFPLQHGVYYVGHGGNDASINYHQVNEKQRYAMDILQLNKLGTRAKGLFPKQLHKYKIYAASVYSPCSGQIEQAENELEQLTPMDLTKENEDDRMNHAEGNHVYIACEGVDVLLAHMIPGSVTVDEGEKVRKGDEIGKVGNSGNTTEPHLHIHAERDGEGVPITFQKRFLKRNSLVLSNNE